MRSFPFSHLESTNIFWGPPFWIASAARYAKQYVYPVLIRLPANSKGGISLTGWKKKTCS